MLRFGLLVSVCLLAPTASRALGILESVKGDPILEIQQDQPSNAEAYVCTDCDLATFQALTAPAGYSKTPVRVTEANFAVNRGVTTLPDFVGLDAVGHEFQLVARLEAPPFEGGVEFLCGLPIAPGFCGAVAHLESDRTFTFLAGETVHELRIPFFDGDEILIDTFILFASANPVGLDEMLLPPGWFYQTRVLAGNLVVQDPTGFPDVYTDVQNNLWQFVVAVPEPGPFTCVALGLAALAAGRTRRRE